MKIMLVVVLGAASLFCLANCADTTVSTIAPGTLTGRHALGVYVPRFIANPRWASELTGVFISDLMAKSKAVVVRGDTIMQDSPEATGYTSGLPETEKAFGGITESTAPSGQGGIIAARRQGAGLMVAGDVTTNPASGPGFIAVATMQIVRLSDGVTVARLRHSVTGPDEKQTAIDAVKATAAAMAAGY
ncbi:hypothetical protein BH09VER1_BH09VER1_43530 [soil metagenome]